MHPDNEPAPSLVLGADESWPHYAEDEVSAVTAVLRSGKVNQWTGDRVRCFEEAYERYVGSGHAVALANGSVALELALRAHGIGPGDEVIVTPRSFVASASCVRLVGAVPVFADVDAESGNISPAAVAEALTERTRAVIPVHLAGWPVDMQALMALAAERDLLVIEDCAQAHGARIGDRPIGSFGHAAAFSFCQDKIITTGGEGGLTLFQDPAAFEAGWSFKDHGKNRSKIAPVAPGGAFRWLHDSIGTNWRMLEMSASIGLLQLDKLERWRATRERNAMIWAEALEGVEGVRVPLPPADMTGAYYKLYAYVDIAGDEGEAARNRILASAAQSGLRVFGGSCSEIYLEQAFADLQVEPLPVARELGRTSLMLEVHPTLNPDRLKARAAAFARFVEAELRSGG